MVSLLSKKTKTRKFDEDSSKVLPYQSHDVPDKLTTVVDSYRLPGEKEVMPMNRPSRGYSPCPGHEKVSGHFRVSLWLF